MSVTLRPLTQADGAWFLPLNNAAVPHVNALEAADLAALLDEAVWARAAERDGVPLGGLIAFGPGAAYASPNYRWFDTRHADFVYIDRVVVDEAARGLGLGRALYAALRDAWRGRTVRLCCEVNERPANEGSMRFHETFGFRIVGRQETDGGGKSVALMECPLEGG